MINNIIYRVSEGSPSEFTLFSISHIVTLMFCMAALILIFRMGQHLKDKSYEVYIRYAIIVYLLFTSTYNILYKVSLEYPWYRYIPEGLCTYGVLLSAITLLTKNRLSFVLAFFYGWGALLALIVPNVLEGPYRYYYYQFFIRHLLIVLSPIYMMKVFDYKVYRKDYGIYFIVTFPVSIIAYLTTVFISRPNELNILYMVQPAISGTYLDIPYNISPLLYTVLWVLIAIVFGYIYGIMFYKKK